MFNKEEFDRRAEDIRMQVSLDFKPVHDRIAFEDINKFSKGGDKNKKNFIALLDKALLKHPQFNTPEWRLYFINIADTETGGTFNMNAKSKSSTAFGPFQLLSKNRSTGDIFTDMFNLTNNNKVYLRNNLSNSLLATLRKSGYTMPEMMALAHFSGAKGAVNFLTSGKSITDANGTTSNQYLNAFRKRSRGSKADIQVVTDGDKKVMYIDPSVYEDFLQLTSELPVEIEEPIIEGSETGEISLDDNPNNISRTVVQNETVLPEVTVTAPKVYTISDEDLLPEVAQYKEPEILEIKSPEVSLVIADLSKLDIDYRQRQLEDAIIRQQNDVGITNSAFKYALAQNSNNLKNEIEALRFARNISAYGGRLNLPSFRGGHKPLPEVYADGGNLFVGGGDKEDPPSHPSKIDLNWFNLWLSHRTTLLAENTKTMNGDHHPIDWLLDKFKSDLEIADNSRKQLLKNLAGTTEYVGLNIPDNVYKIAVLGPLRQDVSDLSKEVYTNKDLGREYLSYIEGGHTDYAKSLGQYIYYPYQSDKDKNKIHEETHALWAAPQHNKILLLQQDFTTDNGGFLKAPTKWNYNFLNGDTEYNYYLDKSNEIYSRLMQFRHDNKLDPTHKVTLQDLNRWRKEGKLKSGSSGTTEKLGRYSDKFLLRLFNEVALNDNLNYLESESIVLDPINITAYGGNLFDDGGYKNILLETDNGNIPTTYLGVTPTGDLIVLDLKGNYRLGTLEGTLPDTAIERYAEDPFMYTHYFLDMSDMYINRATAEDRDEVLPYDGNVITLTNAGSLSGSKLRDSWLTMLADAGSKYGLSPEESIGLAALESTLGNPTDTLNFYRLLSPEMREHAIQLAKAEGRDPYKNYQHIGAYLEAQGDIHDSEESNGNTPRASWIVNNRDNYYRADPFTQTMDYVYGNHGKPGAYAGKSDEEIEEVFKNEYYRLQDKFDNYLPALSALDNAYLTYVKGTYNRGYEKETGIPHEVAVRAKGLELINSPEYQAWLKAYLARKQLKAYGGPLLQEALKHVYNNHIGLSHI